jgi:glycosyltransferase involved in cell wall biosynthesis
MFVVMVREFTMSENMFDKSLVSIVLPTYKRAHVLPCAIRSVLNQTYTNLELIIVDDNSPDDTSSVVESFNDSRIRYVRNDPNLKLPRALNRGFSLACGEYLTWTSDDNIYAANAIEKMVDAMKTENCDFVYADYYHFADLDTNSQPIAPLHIRLPSQVQLERGNHIGACFLYTRKLYEKIGDYDPELFLVEDYDYAMRIAKRFKMAHIPEPLYYFRRDDDTLYCSRFCEVNASDVLVRYKNELLDEQTALDAIITIVLGNIEGLKQPLLRWAYPMVKNISYRLTVLHKSIATVYLRWCLRGRVVGVLNEYRTGRATFKEARDMLMAIMQHFGTIEYKHP